MITDRIGLHSVLSLPLLICFTFYGNYRRGLKNLKIQKAESRRENVAWSPFAILFAVNVTLNSSILEQLPFSYVMILRQAVNCHSISLKYSISALAILSRVLSMFAFRFRSRLALNYLPKKWIVFPLLYLNIFLWNCCFHFLSSNSVCNHTRDQQIGLLFRSCSILLITRMITDRIRLHSVLLPLLICFAFHGNYRRGL